MSDICLTLVRHYKIMPLSYDLDKIKFAFDVAVIGGGPAGMIGQKRLTWRFFYGSI